MFIENIFDEFVEKLEKLADKTNPVISVGNDGIGSYEYWGAKGFDKGVDYYFTEEEPAELVVSLPYAATTVKKLVDYINDCDVYESFVKSYIETKYDAIEFNVRYKVVSVKIVDGGLSVTIEFGEVEKC